MKKIYRRRNRVASVRVYFTPNQIAVLMNSALASGRPVDMGREAQFLIDWALSDGGAAHDHIDQVLGAKALPFNRELLPDPQHY